MISQSQIIPIGEHYFTLPPTPRLKDSVLFVREPQVDQFWRRQNDFPQVFYDYCDLTIINAPSTKYDLTDGYLSHLSREDTKLVFELQTRELDRRVNGVWFMNNGELTYLTGGQYFQLQWGAMPDYSNPYDGSNYGEYRQFQRDVHYMLQLAKLDIQCGGAFFGKPKKTGITQLMALDYLNESTMVPEKRFGMMSKSEKDCVGTNFMYFKYGLQLLPQIMKPTIANITDTKIIFDNPKVKPTGTKGSKLRTINAGSGFNSEVFVRGTVKNAFDGPKMYRGWLDEFPKYEDPYPKDVFDGNSESVKLGSKIIGKLWLTSYVPENDGKNFLEAREIWNNSKERTRSEETGRTLSEIYTYFISALDSGEEQFDRYGRSDRDKVKKYIMAAREQRKSDNRKLQAYTRQYPITEEEMWAVGGGGDSIFNNVVLGKQFSQIKKGLDSGDLPFIEGKFEWMGGRLKSEVIFLPTTDEEIMANIRGRFHMYGLQYLDNMSFNVPFIKQLRTEDGLIRPNPFTPYVGAVDPTDYLRKKDAGVGSQNAGYVLNFSDIALNTQADAEVSNKIVCKYHYRHDNPDDTYEDIVKMVWFFGMYVLIEANKPWVIKKFVDDGLENFLLVRDANNIIKPYQKWVHSKLPHTTAEVIQDIIRAIQKYIVSHCRLIEDDKLIEQLMVFDPKDTKVSDLVMAFGLALISMESFLVIKTELQKTQGLYEHVGAAIDTLETEF